MIGLEFYDKQDKVKYDKSLLDTLRDIMENALLSEGIENREVEISLTFVDDCEIREINKAYRDMDKSTDVLSFPQYHSVEDINTTFGPIILGDIVISLETAVRQAEEYGHSFEREVAFLTSHSMFHLMGYDHDNDENTQEMRAKEEAILENMNITR